MEDSLVPCEHRYRTMPQDSNAGPARNPGLSCRRYDRIRPQDDGAGKEGERPALHFGLDVGPYLLAPLGECFAKSQRYVEGAVSDVITKEWRCSQKDGWIEDERERRKIFRDGETYESRSSNPRTHDLNFYLVYHAMMVVAGRLLATVPVHRDPDYPEVVFDKWLSNHGLTRADGGWLADRRDPDPLERPSWKDDARTDDWRWSLCRDYFDTLLFLPGLLGCLPCRRLRTAPVDPPIIAHSCGSVRRPATRAAWHRSSGARRTRDPIGPSDPAPSFARPLVRSSGRYFGVDSHVSKSSPSVYSLTHHLTSKNEQR